jgi:hypothetical protein
MLLVTYFRHRNTCADHSEAINNWLNKNYSTLYVQGNNWFVATNICDCKMKALILPLIGEFDTVAVFLITPGLLSNIYGENIVAWLNNNWRR